MAATPLPIHVGTHGCQMAGYLYPLLLSSKSHSLPSLPLFAGVSQGSLACPDQPASQEFLRHRSSCRDTGALGHSKESATVTPKAFCREQADSSSLPLSLSLLQSRDEERRFFARCLLVNDDTRGVKTLAARTATLFLPEFCVASPSHSPSLSSDAYVSSCAIKNFRAGTSFKREEIGAHDTCRETYDTGAPREKQTNPISFQNMHSNSDPPDGPPQPISRTGETADVRPVHRSDDTFAASYAGLRSRKGSLLSHPCRSGSAFFIPEQSTRNTGSRDEQRNPDKRAEEETNMRCARNESEPQELPTLLESHAISNKAESRSVSYGHFLKPHGEAASIDTTNTRKTCQSAVHQGYWANNQDLGKTEGSAVKTRTPPGRASASGQKSGRLQPCVATEEEKKRAAYTSSRYTQSTFGRSGEALRRRRWQEEEWTTRSSGENTLASVASVGACETLRTVRKSGICGLKTDKPSVVSCALGKIRRQLERQDDNWHCSGFLLLSDTSEGGGSGLVATLLEELRDRYRTAPIGVVALWPPKAQMNCVAKYNLVLHSAWSQVSSEEADHLR